jgi:hypothetical protein
MLGKDEPTFVHILMSIYLILKHTVPLVHTGAVVNLKETVLQGNVNFNW